jgi:ComF family protein
MRLGLGYIGVHGRRLADRFLSFFYPSHCPVCRNPSDTHIHSPICLSCWGTIERYRGPSCRVCAVPIVSSHARLCGECLSRPPSFSSVLAYGLYSGTLREAVHLFKFRGIRRLGRPLGRLLCSLPVPKADMIVPVPLSKGRLRQRGFNQSLLLARSLSKDLGIHLSMDCLVKRRDTPPQTGLGANERVKNLKNAFETRGDVAGKRVILLDDVMTTGATVRECAKTLARAGAGEIIVVVLARSAFY